MGKKNKNRFLNQRRKLWEWQKRECNVCKRDMPFSHATLEHVVPRSALNKRKNRPDNFVVTCQWCNHKRGTKPLAEFREFVAKLKFTNQPLGPTNAVDLKARKNRMNKKIGKIMAALSTIRGSYYDEELLQDAVAEVLRDARIGFEREQPLDPSTPHHFPTTTKGMSMTLKAECELMATDEQVLELAPELEKQLKDGQFAHLPGFSYPLTKATRVLCALIHARLEINDQSGWEPFIGNETVAAVAARYAIFFVHDHLSVKPFDVHAEQAAHWRGEARKKLNDVRVEIDGKTVEPFKSIVSRA